jgi:hypothetical protein
MGTNAVPAGLKNSPGIWFGLLCRALARHDFDDAAAYQRELRRLGVTVKFSSIPKDESIADERTAVRHAR